MSYSSFLCSYGSGSDPIKNDDFSGGSGMGTLGKFFSSNALSNPTMSARKIFLLPVYIKHRLNMFSLNVKFAGGEWS